MTPNPRSYVWQSTCGVKPKPERLGVVTLNAALNNALARMGLTAPTHAERMTAECAAAKRRKQR